MTISNSQRTDDTIARAILDQMGGQRALAIMTGAKQFLYSEDSLSFRLPLRSGGAKWTANGCNIVRVVYDNGADAYTVTFEKQTGMNAPKVISRHDEVYCDRLAELFRDETGLENRVPTIHRA